MRVGVDFHTWDGIFQGSRSHVLEIYKQAILIAPDIEFFFFLKDIDGLKRSHAEFTNPNVTLVSMPTVPSVARLTAQLTYFRVRHRIDVLHTQYRLPLFPMGPTVCTIHDVLFEDYPQYFTPFFVAQSKVTVKWAAKNATKVLTVSQYSQSEIAKKYGVPIERIGITHNAWSPSRFNPNSQEDDLKSFPFLKRGHYIVSVGRLEPRKNYPKLIEAWSRLGQAAPELVIIGQPDFDFDEVTAAVERLGTLGERIHLLSKVGDSDLPKLIRNSIFFAYLAHAEGFGMPPLEAMACGVPVLVSNNTSLPEVVGDGGILVNQNDTEAISTAMQKLINDKALRDQLISRGLAQARNFNWHSSASVLVDTLRAASRRQ